MIALLLAFCIALAETILATYVVTCAWTYRPARLFALLIAALLILQISSILRAQPGNLGLAYAGRAGVVLGLCAFDAILLLLLSARFMPQWWEGSCSIRWIILPYLLVFVVLSIDLLVPAGLFISGIYLEDGVYRSRQGPGGGVMLALLNLSWLPHLSILGITWKRRRRLRPLIGGLVVAIVFGGLIGISTQSSGAFSRVYGLGQSLPFVGVLAYAVVRGRLFEPTQAALDLALRAMSEAVAVLDPEGQIVYANPQAVRLGLRPARTLAEALRDAGAAPDEVAQLIAQRASDPTRAIGRRFAIGSPVCLHELTLTTVSDEEGTIHGTLLLGRDISEIEHRNQLLEFERMQLAEAVRKLSYQARHDALTGLPNRRSLEEELYRLIARSRRGREGALLFLDLDNFKLVNDTLGHSAGDKLLVAVSQLLAQQLRSGDVLARLGGDEFAVLLEGMSMAQAQAVAERLRATVEGFRFTLEGRSFELGLSVGLVAIDGRQDAHVLLAQADIAMYAAKERGRNRVVSYQDTDDYVARLSEANAWASRIKDALRDDRFVLHFQPVVYLGNMQVTHYETLIRMVDQQGALIPPGAFIPAAERFGLMPQIDRWIVQQTIRTLQAHPTITLFMNLSGRSLLDEALVDFIAAELRERGVEPARLGFEITETAAVQDFAHADRWIRQIKALGCHFVLDDFGVGFTSFAYLRHLPIDQVKIDGSFIQTIDRDAHNRAIVRAIHTLALELGKATVAEFVERPAVLEVLREIGITYAQGYYLGRPGPDLPLARPPQMDWSDQSRLAQPVCT
jgi:diguanylate cyclase (GGDEF)-like protein